MKSVRKQVGRWLRQWLSSQPQRSSKSRREALRTLDDSELKQVAGGVDGPATHPTKGW